MNKLLLEHLKNCKDILLAYSKSIAIADHNINLGSAREALASSFLSTNLPRSIKFETGELFDCDGNRSGQIDLLISPDSSPRMHLYGAINIHPVDTVLAAIEVKSNLTTCDKGTLHDALRNCYKAKDLNKINRSDVPIGSGKISLYSVPYLIFAFIGAESSTVLECLDTCLKEDKKDLKDAPDMIVVLDRGYYLSKSIRWQFAGQTVNSVYDKIENNEYVLLGIYEFLLGLSELWATNINYSKMPLERYIEDLPNLFEFFDDKVK